MNKGKAAQSLNCTAIPKTFFIATLHNYKLFKADREKGRKIKALESSIKQLEESNAEMQRENEQRLSLAEEELQKANEKIKYYENLSEKFKNQYNAEFEKSSYYKSLIDGIAQKPLVKMYLKDKEYPKK